MTCQGGCVGGAGQPYGLKKSKEKRGDGLHLSDNAAMFKRAERNPVVAADDGGIRRRAVPRATACDLHKQVT